MRAKMQEFKIPNDSQIRAMEWLAAANIDGPGFVQIPEEEFKARLPEVFISFFYYLPSTTSKDVIFVILVIFYSGILRRKFI